MQLKDRELLAALMASKKLSGRTLAKQAGWESHTYLQRLLRGEVNTLKPERAIIIAHYLGVPLELLFVPRVDRNTIHNGDDDRPKKVPA
jgi:transcriptional regulator with XRE-family HTH domain